MKFTAKMKSNGELAVRELSKKAQAFYNNTDPFYVYEYEIWPDDDNALLPEKYYAYNWIDDIRDGFTLEELEMALEQLVDEIWTDEDIEIFIGNVKRTYRNNGDRKHYGNKEV